MKYRVQRVDGLIVVRSHIWTVTGETSAFLAIDTGSLFTVVRPGALAATGLDVATLTEAIRVTTASRNETAPVVTADLAALGLRREQMKVVVHDLPRAIQFQGLLGLDFFEGHRLTLDLTAGTVELD